MGMWVRLTVLCAGALALTGCATTDRYAAAYDGCDQEAGACYADCRVLEEDSRREACQQRCTTSANRCFAQVSDAQQRAQSYSLARSDAAFYGHFGLWSYRDGYRYGPYDRHHGLFAGRYDRWGYDRWGYDRYGFDWRGYHRDGRRYRDRDDHRRPVDGGLACIDGRCGVRPPTRPGFDEGRDDDRRRGHEIKRYAAENHIYREENGVRALDGRAPSSDVLRTRSSVRSDRVVVPSPTVTVPAPAPTSRASAPSSRSFGSVKTQRQAPTAAPVRHRETPKVRSGGTRHSSAPSRVVLD